MAADLVKHGRRPRGIRFRIEIRYECCREGEVVVIQLPPVPVPPTSYPRYWLHRYQPAFDSCASAGLTVACRLPPATWTVDDAEKIPSALAPEAVGVFTSPAKGSPTWRSNSNVSSSSVSSASIGELVEPGCCEENPRTSRRRSFHSL